MSAATPGGPRSSSSAGVVVVGGGVIGVCCAYELASRGAEVVLLERDHLASGSSHGNAGTVSAGHPPLNRPGRIRQALTQMLDSTSPLYVRPRWDPALWRWLWRFALHCTEEHVRAAMEIMAPLGKEALELFDRLVEEEAVACGYTREGYYDVCRTEAGLAGASHEAGIIETHGYHPEVVSGDELRYREPELGGAVVGGVYYPEAATLDPLAFVHEVADRARQQGARLREGVEVTDVLLEHGRAAGVRLADASRVDADAVVLATGPFALDLSARLGTSLPVQPGKGYHRDVAVGEGGAPPMRIACVINESSVFCTPMRDVVRFAGTMELSGLNHLLRRERLEQLTTAARTVLPRLGAAAPASEWCGLRPMCADGLPIVGPLPGAEGFCVATGHGMLGLTLGPVTARIVADHLLGGGDRSLYPGLSPSRFR